MEFDLWGWPSGARPEDSSYVEGALAERGRIRMAVKRLQDTDARTLQEDHVKGWNSALQAVLGLLTP